jgi:hypothetical protein
VVFEQGVELESRREPGVHDEPVVEGGAAGVVHAIQVSSSWMVWGDEHALDVGETWVVHGDL